MRWRALLALLVILAAAVLGGSAHASGSASVAALQVGLRSHGFYRGAIDGIRGPQTTHAILRLQKRARIAVDGVVGPQTRRALGRYARHRFGSRLLKRGKRGWDVAALQFELARHGFPSGPLDGIFGPRSETALRRFQVWAGMREDGIAGPSTLGALTQPPPAIPLPLEWPIRVGVLGDRFGPRGERFHAGLDFPARRGTPVYAARSGEVVYAGWRNGGWGFVVSVAHGRGERTVYAHLSRIDVRIGVRVGQGVRVGLVGSSGDATGPHLHFEVRIRGAAVDPLRALPAET